MSFIDAVRVLFTKPYQSITPTEAGELLQRGAILLDVREPAEWQAGHAPKARRISPGQLAQRQRELPTGRTTITVCRSGARSARDVHNLAGGMSAWAAAGLPVIAKGGGPGRVA